jgi:hypothetical protein
VAKSLSIIDRRLRDAIESKLKLLTSATEEYFWHAGADLAARWKDAQAKLRRPVLRPLTVILQQFEAVADDTNQEIRTAQAAVIDGKASAEFLLDRALASIERLNLAALAIIRRLNESLKVVRTLGSVTK